LVIFTEMVCVNYAVRSFTKCESGDRIKVSGMGGACGTEGERRGAYRVWWGKLKERRTWKTEV
jgi:hypothetical protein